MNGKLPESGESGIPDDFGIGDFVDKSALIAVTKQICAHDAAIYVCESSEKIW